MLLVHDCKTAASFCDLKNWPFQAEMPLPDKNIADAAREHTLFIKPGCNFCELFIKHIINTDIERSINIVDVTRVQVDPRQIHSVPTLVVSHQAVYVGRDAFAWLLHELKRVVAPAPPLMAVGAAQAFSLDGTSDDLAPMASVHFKEPEPPPKSQGNSDQMSIDERLARIKADRERS